MNALAPVSLLVMFVGLFFYMCVPLVRTLELILLSPHITFTEAVSLNNLCGNSVGCSCVRLSFKGFTETKLKSCLCYHLLFFLTDMLFAIAGTLAKCLKNWSLLFGIDKGEQIQGKHIFYSVSSCTW